MIGIELVAGYLANWALRKARRAGRRLDVTTDDALDAALDRLHDVVATKISGEPALVQLQQEAIGPAMVVSDRTVKRVTLAVEEAAESDATFAAALELAVAAVREAVGVHVVATGSHGVSVGGNMTINALNSGVAAAVVHGSVTTNHPPQPGSTSA